MLIHPSRREAASWLLACASTILLPAAAARSESENELIGRFNFLAENGNSNCSAKFLVSILSLPDTARLQGSCCGPMALHRYREQIAGLRSYAGIAAIPPDPYDVEVGLAKRSLAAYDFVLTGEQQAAYDLAMKLSAEGGPCCCECWRWHVFGGVGKLLIREHGFDGAQLAKFWDLSDGCGGDSHAH